MDEENVTAECPICNRHFLQSTVEEHVDKCLFLNSSDKPAEPKRKRVSEPILPIDDENYEIISGNTSPTIGCQDPSSLSLKSNIVSPNNTAESYFNKLFSQNKSSKKISPNSKHNDLKHNTQRKLIDKLNNQDKHDDHGDKYKNRDSRKGCSNIKENLKENFKVKPGDKFMFTSPLADMVRPKTIDDFFGQSSVVGENTALRVLLSRQEIPNMILWGPPGCGKTSLAGIIREICKSHSSKFAYVKMCATDAGVKDVKKIVDAAKIQKQFGKKTILFMDEIHRFNKRQQDTFLGCVEKGEITLLGATTENPSFSINNALLSRCRVIPFDKLKTDDMLLVLMRAINLLEIEVVDEETESSESLKLHESAITWLAETCDGDARIALDNLQTVLQFNKDVNKVIVEDDIKEGLKKSHMLYDRKGEEHYNIISAMHKSIRASDDNAALYWTSRMIVSGEDPLYVARRLVRAASEDIGNADPQALQLAVSTMQGVQLLGMPEADVLLAQCAIYLARAPKSREADDCLAAAKRLIGQCKGPQPAVPMHIRNAPTRLMKNLGYGKLANGARKSFLPEGLEDVNFFH